MVQRDKDTYQILVNNFKPVNFFQWRGSEMIEKCPLLVTVSRIDLYDPSRKDPYIEKTRTRTLRVDFPKQG